MRDRLIELLQEASTEAGKHFRETTKKVLAEKGRFNSATDIDRRNIYEVEADYLLADGWMRPPCKVGDVVKSDAIYYRIYRTESYSDFETPIHHRYWAEPINDEGEDDFWFWSDSIEEGTVVVCSKEEAEQMRKDEGK